MNNNKNIPFANLHSHSTYSVYDAIGYPDEHMNFCLENGMSSLALTDHGNMNGTSYQILHAKKMKKEGKGFKPIFGIEVYFHPSISDWKSLKDKTKIDDEIGSLVLEDESTTKTLKKNPLNKRSHMILLAQNQKGLNNLFRLVSESFKSGNFYRFPRIDYNLLKIYNEGIIATSACLGGIYATDYWENKELGEKAILEAMRETTRKMKQIFQDRWFGELQWNAIKEQHELNQYIIQIAKECDIKLISTADSHYPRPELWKDRILYKKLNPRFIDKEKTSLPNSINDVGYELFPKNGKQMMEAYEKYSSLSNFKYESDLIKQSIINTAFIAEKMIEDFIPENTIKLPDFLLSKNESDINKEFADKCYSNLKEKNLNNEQYKSRLDKEINVICRNGFAKYFLTMEKIHEKASNMCLIGSGRGSAAGALVSYLLGITQTDPIRHELLFERFMTVPQASGFNVPNKYFGGIKTTVDKAFKVEFEDGSICYLTEDLVKGLK